MALAVMSREGDLPFLVVLADDEDLLVRAGQVGARCGLKVTPGAIAPPHPAEATRALPVLVWGSLVLGPRSGFDKLFEVLTLSGDPDEAALARAAETALADPPAHEIRCGGRTLRAASLDAGGRPLVMGILNVTPDSFSDGGRYAEPAAAVARGEEMASQGADILDVGGESTRPGSSPVPAAEEIRRVLPVVEALAVKGAAPVSIDTTKAEVARAAVGAGASMINDVSGMTMDPGMPAVAAELKVPVVLNHIRGVPRTMQDSPRYEHVVLEVLLDLAVRVRAARLAGVAPSQILVDPGLGFGKRPEDNLALLRHFAVFRSLGCPVLAGASRKSFLGAVTGRGVRDRAAATLAAEVLAAAAGAHILRTHDPASAVDALKVAQAVAHPPS
jgi:dihydropteroate synthase